MGSGWFWWRDFEEDGVTGLDGIVRLAGRPLHTHMPAANQCLEKRTRQVAPLPGKVLVKSYSGVLRSYDVCLAGVPFAHRKKFVGIKTQTA